MSATAFRRGGERDDGRVIREQSTSRRGAVIERVQRVCRERHGPWRRGRVLVWCGWELMLEKHGWGIGIVVVRRMRIVMRVGVEEGARGSGLDGG